VYGEVTVVYAKEPHAAMVAYDDEMPKDILAKPGDHGSDYRLGVDTIAHWHQRLAERNKYRQFGEHTMLCPHCVDGKCTKRCEKDKKRKKKDKKKKRKG
jgi:hypothetical protein